jgi:hypothetical protein
MNLHLLGNVIDHHRRDHLRRSVRKSSLKLEEFQQQQSPGKAVDVAVREGAGTIGYTVAKAVKSLA